MSASVLIGHWETIRAGLRGLRGLKSAAEGMAKVEAIRDWVLSNVLFVIALGGLISCFVGIVKLARWNRMEVKADASKSTSADFLR